MVKEVTNKVSYKVTNKSEELLLKILSKCPTITIAGIQKKTALSESGVKKILKSLKDKGFISREGSNKIGF
ncbi:MAG TPA: hypothetical protein DDY68_05850 [Porphyromonadaceae bacterium]|nr:hypothetical protein [Porphyromonadaceae bacterium]